MFFYATLSNALGDDESRPSWMAPRWGAYVFAGFRLARDAVTGSEYESLSPEERAPFANNAHVKRETFDAKVLLAGDPDESRCFETVVPLSTGEAGTEANDLVTGWSSDSGKGPWWRRPMRFEEDGVAELLSRAASAPGGSG